MENLIKKLTDTRDINSKNKNYDNIKLKLNLKELKMILIGIKMFKYAEDVLDEVLDYENNCFLGENRQVSLINNITELKDKLTKGNEDFVDTIVTMKDLINIILGLKLSYSYEDILTEELFRQNPKFKK